MNALKNTNRSNGKSCEIDLSKFQHTTHGHNFGGISRVVMVRTTDQTTYASVKNGEEPKYETVTRETYETFHGNRIDKKITSVEKRDVFSRLPNDLSKVLDSPVKTTSVQQSDAKKPLDPAAFANECLTAHNFYRAKHGVPPLKLNRRLCKASQDWADTLAARGKATSSQNHQYGENIYCTWSTNPLYSVSGTEPVDEWYRESDKYQFGTEPTSLAAGHFTQVIWKESKEFGVGISRTKDGKTFVVANYSPAGNCLGSFVQNVPPIGGAKLEVPKSLPKVESYDFEQECLERHNEYRRRHGLQPLVLNKKMCKESKEWAKYLAGKGALEHRKNYPHGENIYCTWSSKANRDMTGGEPVDYWYSEIKNHVFGKEPSNLETGHFTQVVWRASKELGVGMERSRNGQIFVVANYSPAGNFVGSFVRNVPPVLDSPDHSQLGQLEEQTTETFEQEALRIHNEYRRKHGVPDLELDEDMCAYAKSWASQLAKEGKLAHRPDCRYGENIFCMWSSDPSCVPSAQEVCRKWYSEIKEFQFGQESRTLKAGHFTQMIWKESRRLGVAMSRGKNNSKTFVVANYDPKGNYVGRFADNVPRPQTGK